MKIGDVSKEAKRQANIGLSEWVSFKPKDKKLIMKMFKITLDYYIKKAKKSHRIKLICLWQNMGYYKKGEAWGGGPRKKVKGGMGNGKNGPGKSGRGGS